MLGRSALIALLALLMVTPLLMSSQLAAAQDEPITVARLLQGFAQMTGLTTHFREEKRIALLAVPIRSEGTIAFAPGGRLLRRVTSPTESAALVSDGQLTLESGGRRESIDLSQNAVVRAFVQSFGHILSGDRTALERSYDLSLTAEGTRWTLTLTPKTDALKRFLRTLVLHGEGRGITRMVMNEVSGDSTTTTFTDTNATKRWTPEELERTFRL